MSLPGVMTVLIEAVADSIEEYIDAYFPERAKPERVLRYHGDRQMPQDCCTEAGYVVGNWRAVGHTTSKQQASGALPAVSGFLGTAVDVRYVTCWPDSPDGVETRDDDWDETTAFLAGLAEHVARALVCFESKGQPHELLAAAGCRGYAFVSAAPINPLDVCAGVMWSSTVSLIGRGSVP